MRYSPRSWLFLCHLCLFFSGLAGLVYEVVWTRYLALFLGHTSYAVVAVLVAFMGGLALGNLWLGALADRTRRPLVFYAWVEIAIGIYALAFPAYYNLCHNLFLELARQAGLGSPGLLTVRFLFSLCTILVPTILMGGTLPLLTRAITRSLGELRKKVATLYSINSAGAVLGIVLTDFWWIEAIGLESTVFAAAAVNLAAGTLALLLHSAAREPATQPVPTVSPPGTPDAPRASEPESARRGTLKLALAGIALSGFVAMLYQVAWTRLLGLVLGSSTHAFALVLMVFIGGLAVGAGIVGRWRNPGRAWTAFGWTEVGLAVSVGLSMAFYEYLPFIFARMADLLPRRVEAYPAYELLQGLICFAVLFVPTVCLGMTLPLVAQAATPELDRAGQAVGRVFALNTVGAVLGALVTGLVLMPWLGLARTLGLGVLANLGIGAGVLHAVGTRRTQVGSAAGLLAAGVLLLGALPHWNAVWPRCLTLGTWRPQDATSTLAAYREAIRNSHLLYHKDGAGATVSVHQLHGTGEDLFLKVNGKTDACTGADMATQLLLGHLPMLLKPEAHHVLGIGLGSGVTAGAVACHPTLKRVEVVEISPEVADAARCFAAHNRRILDDPRLALVIEDAKSFLLTTTHSYDVIVSEPSNPWMAGVAGVFSAEFYQRCREHLAPNGLMAQWVQLYEFSDAALEMVIATFASAFPHVSLWNTGPADVLLLGSVTPPHTDLDAFAERLQEPAVRADLDRSCLANVPLLLAHELLSARHAPFVPGPETPLHTDGRPRLEFRAQRDFFTRAMADRFRSVDETLSRRPTTRLGTWLQSHAPTVEDYRAFARMHTDRPTSSLDLLATVVLRWTREHPESREPLQVASRFRFAASPRPLETLRLRSVREALWEQALTHPALMRQYGVNLMRHYREQRSCFFAPATNELRRVLDRLIAVDPDHQRVYQAHLAVLAWDAGDDRACLDFGRKALLPDLPRGSAMFSLDRTSLLHLVARMAQVLADRGELNAAVNLVDSPLVHSHLDEATRPGALGFDLTRRRVHAAFEAGPDRQR